MYTPLLHPFKDVIYKRAKSKEDLILPIYTSQRI